MVTDSMNSSAQPRRKFKTDELREDLSGDVLNVLPPVSLDWLRKIDSEVSKELNRMEQIVR